MSCAYDYCLYNKGYKCTLDGVNIDSLGHCDDCITVKIDSDMLESEKERQLNKLSNGKEQRKSTQHVGCDSIGEGWIDDDFVFTNEYGKHSFATQGLEFGLDENPTKAIRTCFIRHYRKYLRSHQRRY